MPIKSLGYTVTMEISFEVTAATIASAMHQGYLAANETQPFSIIAAINELRESTITILPDGRHVKLGLRDAKHIINEAREHDINLR